MGCLDVFPSIALSPAALAHPARPGLEPAHPIVHGTGRHAALALGGDEVVRYGFGELPDRLNAMLLTESLETPSTTS